WSEGQRDLRPRVAKSSPPRQRGRRSGREEGVQRSVAKLQQTRRLHSLRISGDEGDCLQGFAMPGGEYQVAFSHGCAKGRGLRARRCPTFPQIAYEQEQDPPASRMAEGRLGRERLTMHSGHRPLILLALPPLRPCNAVRP